MTDAVLGTGAAAPRPKLDQGTHVSGKIAFLLVLLGGIAFAAWNIVGDMRSAGETIELGVFALLGLALLIALGFEFVNGFHDTANAVATVIYTHSLPPLVAVVWSGAWNFLGVMVSSGAVAYGIITLLPVELILQVGSTAGYAMIFALLIAAIIWNLGTWALGIPNSSSHALIGSIMGVGLANQLMAPAGQATSGVDWSQAAKIGQALLFSPLCGFIASALLLLVAKVLIRNKSLYEAPKTDAPPPWWIRGLLIFTCTSVSFAHGGNDGQKGMGLIMLILIGAAPTAYALNRALPASAMPAFERTIDTARPVLAAHSAGVAPVAPATAREILGKALRTHKVNSPAVFGAMNVLSADIETQVKAYGSIRRIPAAAVPNVRNEMYMVGDGLRQLGKQKGALTAAEAKPVAAFGKSLQAGTRFIPYWVKVSVAIALGLGTMVGWKRIVVTVGERIGKTHLTYAQGAAAELVAAGTISLAEVYGLPVSTTHILSSGVAGTMAANGSGLQWSTIRSIASAWVMTLPAAIALAGLLYFILRTIMGA
ncbi:MAG TPA: inorganic phosphate transporter [Caulobacteraceae bacterium]|jgi:PiT family inorganic phosphate transporter